MFYCTPCARAARPPWPESFACSRGPCEVCGKVADCNDVPSSALPMPERSPAREQGWSAEGLDRLGRAIFGPSWTAARTPSIQKEDDP